MRKITYWNKPLLPPEGSIRDEGGTKDHDHECHVASYITREGTDSKICPRCFPKRLRRNRFLNSPTRKEPLTWGKRLTTRPRKFTKKLFGKGFEKKLGLKKGPSWRYQEEKKHNLVVFNLQDRGSLRYAEMWSLDTRKMCIIDRSWLGDPLSPLLARQNNISSL